MHNRALTPTLLFTTFAAMDIISSKISKTITFLREQKGLTIEQMADKASVSSDYIQDVENPETEVLLDQLALVADAFCMKMSEVAKLAEE